jgi:hypothetical protein
MLLDLEAMTGKQSPKIDQVGPDQHHVVVLVVTPQIQTIRSCPEVEA